MLRFFRCANFFGILIMACVAFIGYDYIRKNKESEKTTILQKVVNRAGILLTIITTVAASVVVFFYQEQAKATVVSEKSFSVVDADLQAEDKTINLTIQDQNGTAAEVTYGLPDYSDSISKTLNIRSSVIDELQPNGNSDILILQEFADGNRKVVLEGSEGGEISDMLESYALKMAAE